MFKDKLKKLRTDKNLTQEQLAKIIFVSRSAICKWEIGNGIPSEDNIKALCDYFNVDEDFLLEKEDYKNYVNEKIILNQKITVSSLLSMIVVLVLFAMFFIKIFKRDLGENVIIAIGYNKLSMFDMLSYYSLIPISLLISTFTFSVINIMKSFKQELVNKMLKVNYAFLLVSVLVFIMFFIISITIASKTHFILWWR